MAKRISLKDLFNRNKGFKIDFKFWKWNKKQWKRFIIGTLSAFLIIIITTVAWFSKDLPTPGKIRNLKAVESTQFFDREGNRLYSATGDKMRILIDKDKIPERMKQATIAAEDHRFYSHHGINFKGIARALIYNTFHLRSYTSGGSTITQQFIKNALLDPRKTYVRKIKEAILAVELEMLYSKEDILAMYLNEIPYGSSAYGIEAASQIYFSKHASELNLAECATLASLPKAPTYYSPYGTHTDDLTARKNYVLDQMKDLGYITEKQASNAKKTKLTFKRRKENIIAPHFVMYAQEIIAQKYGDRIIEEGGYKVYTTLDPNKQQFAEDAINLGAEKILSRYGATNAAIVSLDPKTGEILAMVGSKDYFDLENDGNVNVTLSNRSPGSSFKPIVYATGFKDKWSPASNLFDLKTDFGGGYIPQNYSGNFKGPISIRDSLANSLNIPAVKMLALVGIDEAVDTARDMGITTLEDKDRFGLSLAIGGGETKLLEMAGAYGVFANQGKRANTTPILKVIDKEGKTIFENKPKPKEVLDEQIAYEISNILSDNNARTPTFGANSYLNVQGHTVAAKTGTSQDYRDAHTVGYSSSIVTAVWVGNNNNSPISGHAAGSMAAAPIWHNYMINALKNTANEEFAKPDGISQLTVDALTGLLPGSQTPLGVRTDIFASWQVPKERSDIYNTVKIDKSCGDKLASDLTPEEMIEEKTYANIHSEMPKNPNWENPVRGWANSVGLGSIAPTEICEVHSETNKPSVKISSPKQSSSVSGMITLSISANAPLGVSKVEYSIDNVLIGTATKSPWSIKYNTDKLSIGVHKISVRLIDKGMFTANASNSFSVSSDRGAPGEITWDSPAVSDAGIGSLMVSWTNPSDSDLSKIYIYRGIAPESLVKVGSGQAASPSQDQTYTMSGLSSGQTYYFKIITEDVSGNVSNGSSIVSGVCP